MDPVCFNSHDLYHFLKILRKLLDDFFDIKDPNHEFICLRLSSFKSEGLKILCKQLLERQGVDDGEEEKVDVRASKRSKQEASSSSVSASKFDKMKVAELKVNLLLFFAIRGCSVYFLDSSNICRDN